AMHNGIPVVAAAAAAVPETVGGGALCVPPAQPAVLAAAVHKVLTDAPLRDQLVAAGRKRVEELSLANARQRFADALLPVVSP
ncbi:MAG: glycosyltransferase, partial [Acidobacteria bacterium]|nr:glycosyltransferase [Acidobacteriota bacterium]